MKTYPDVYPGNRNIQRNFYQALHGQNRHRWAREYAQLVFKGDNKISAVLRWKIDGK